MFFALEGNLITTGLHSYLPHWPEWLLDVMVGASFILLTWFGMNFLNYLAWITLPVYVVLLICLIHHVAALPSLATTSFLHYPGTEHLNVALAGPFVLQLIAPALAFLSGSALQADIGRFIPKRRRAFTAFCMTYLTDSVSLFVMTLVGAWITIRTHQTNPSVYIPATIQAAIFYL